MFNTFFVADEKEGIRLCVAQDKWLLIDPDDKALFCSDSMKQDSMANNHVCMKELASQALALIDAQLAY
jgi:hypothetical protein